MLTKEERIDTINYMKAFGIIAVVIGHYKHDIFDIFKPYMYHMPLFFFIGGMLFNDKRSAYTGIYNIVKKHWLYIIVNYIAIGYITIFLINNTEFKKTTYPFSDGFFGTFVYAIKGNMHTNELFLVAWFLLAYSIVNMLFILASKIINKNDNNKKFIIFIVSILIGFIGYKYTSFYYKETGYFYVNILTQVLVGFMFFGLGFSFRDKFFDLMNPSVFMVIIISLISLVKLKLISTMTMSWSAYNYGFYNVLITPILFIYCVSFMSFLFAKSVKFNQLLFIGTNSKHIMSYHLLSFIILDIIFDFLGFYELRNSTSISIHYNNNYIWWVYVLFGIYFPILIYFIYHKIKLSLERSLT